MPRFTPGQSGNPAGRKKGTPDRRTQARELFAQHKDALIAKAIELALSGDVAALRMAIDRIVPPLRAFDVPVDLGALPETLAGKGERVLELLAVGELTPDAASIVLGTIARQAQIVAVSELEQRIAALEAAGETP